MWANGEPANRKDLVKNSEPTPPCTPVIVVGLVLMAAGIVWWMWKRPMGQVGVRNGQPTYGYQIEWLAAFLVAVFVLTMHLILNFFQTYNSLILKNNEQLGDAGSYLMLTIGALPFKAVQDRRIVKVTCLAAAGLGFALLLITKWRC